jgi:hypothetical protein
MTRNGELERGDDVVDVSRRSMRNLGSLNAVGERK